MPDLRVASFNVRNGRALDGRHAWPFRRRACVATVAALDADVIGLQEVYAFQLRAILRGSGYTACGDGRSARRRGEHCAVLTRPPLRVVEHVTRWFGDHPDRPGSRLDGARFPRIATTCLLELEPSGVVVQFTNTHLDSRAADRRRRSVEQLVTWLDPRRPQIVVGDFNAEPGAAELEPLGAAGLRPALPADAGGTVHGFTGRSDGRRLDHIFVSDHVEVVAAGVERSRVTRRLPSDHWPVVAELRLTSSQRSIYI